MNRILAVSHTAVWPVRSGAANRRLMTLRALAELGEVDLLYVGEVEGDAARTPGGAAVHETREWPVEKIRPALRERIRWLAAPGRPYQMIEWAEPGDALPFRDRYDVAWYFRPVTLELARGIAAGARVVDLDDLEDHKLLQKRARGSSGPFRRRLAEWRNAHAWTRYQRALAGQVDAVVVCKEEDRRRLGVGNCFVVPNGFPDVSRAAAPCDDTPPTFLLVGLFSYEPNADAAEFFVDRVFPRVAAELPDARVRLVGRATERVRRLEGTNVSVAGEVDDLAPEYDRATAAVVPIRVQSGTRVKILEAFARGVPVVSTSAGAAGLGAVDREHLLIADTAAAFAEACVELARDSDARSRLVDGAGDLYRRRFGQDRVSAAVRAAVRAAAPQ